ELDQHVPGPDLLEAVRLDPDELTVALQVRPAGGGGEAAEDALPEHLVTVGAAGRHAPGAPLVDRAPVDAAAAPPAARAHEVRDDLEPLDPPGKADLLLLDVAAD